MNAYKITVSCDKCAELTRPKTPYRIQISYYTSPQHRLKPIRRGYYASVASYNRLMSVLDSRGFKTDTLLEKYGFASAVYYRKEWSITCYERPSQAYRATLDGTTPIVTHVAIKNYGMRQTSKIGVYSMARIRKLTSTAHRHLSDTGTHWFKTVYYV